MTLTHWLTRWLAGCQISQTKRGQGEENVLPMHRTGNGFSPLLHLPTPTFYSPWMSWAPESDFTEANQTGPSSSVCLFTHSPPHTHFCVYCLPVRPVLWVCQCGSQCNLIQEVPVEESALFRGGLRSVEVINYEALLLFWNKSWS